jgi:hypothetical protein
MGSELRRKEISEGDTPLLLIVFQVAVDGYASKQILIRKPDESTVLTKAATLYSGDTSNKTIQYQAVATDFATSGEYRVVGLVGNGTTLFYHGRPPMILNVSSKWS